MADFQNEFSWSSSRASKFDSCKRAYYFHYYGSWGGWERNATDRVRELYRLKKLTGRAAWAGITVHEIIAESLSALARGGALPELEQAIEAMHTRMGKEYLASRDGSYRSRKTLGLVEHEYQQSVSGARWKENWGRAEHSLRSFYASPILKEIRETPTDQWLPIDSLDTFDFEGTKVYVAPDFAFRDAAGKLRILDWKTGRPRDKDQEQVRGYALFARDRWQASPEELRAELVYLAEDLCDEVPIDAAAIEAYQERLRASIAQMKAALPDPEKNEAREEDFPPISQSRQCRWCNFRRLCEGARLD